MSKQASKQEHSAPIVSEEFVQFLMIHSPLGQMAIEEYFDTVEDNIEQGGNTWALHNPYNGDSDLRFDFHCKGALVGYVVVDREFKARSFSLADGDKQPKRIYTSKSKKPDFSLMTAVQRVEQSSADGLSMAKKS